MTRRLLAAFLGLSIVLLAVLVIPFGLAFADRERADLLAGVERDAVAIAFFVEDDLDPQAVDAGVDLQAVADGYEARTGGRVVVVDRTGVALADSAPPDGESPAGRDFSTRPEIATALSGEVARGTRASDTLGEPLVFVAVPVASGGEVDGAVRVTYPRTEVDERARRNWYVLGGLSLVTLVVAAGLSGLLAASVTGPLRRLRAATAALGAGRLSARAPEGVGPPEVREVAEAFNRMAAQLEQLVASQEQFVADASHELRTPLTALKLRLEVGDLGADGEAALREVDRMARLVDGLLALARADRPELAPRPEAIAVAELLEDRRDAWEPVAADADVELRVETSGAPAVHAARDRLVQILDNLVANALDAAPPRSVIVLRGEEYGGHVEVHVVDAGPGLPPEDRARAFDRFWRAGASRGRFGSSGLGLAIVAKLAAADGADARLEEAPGGGIDAVVRYPAVR